MDASTCHFCAQLEGGEPGPLATRATAVALPERHPHATGHTVVISRRHIGRLSGLTEQEHHDLFALAREVIVLLESEHGPEAFTLGMNDGPAAGQTAPHVHLHIVPRNTGDVEDPRGGIRRSLPAQLS
jgi:diadenosine tetraphosphate (Ap4A) HIT family hydrolase